MFRILATLAATVLGTVLGTAALAGIPAEVDVTCPVGGERFQIVTTLSCSTEHRVTMSMRQLTTCDFVTPLPVCPGNGLPMFREFTPEEVARLDQFLATRDWQAMRGTSAFIRAYHLAGMLEGTDRPAAFGLLVGGVQYDADAFFADPQAVDLYLAAADRERATVSAGDLPYLLASTAYVLAYAGRPEAAAWLAEAEAASDGSDFLNLYLPLVRACLATPGTAECHPDAWFEF